MPTRDDTEQIRKDMLRQINGDPQIRESLERAYGQVWDTDELARDFAVEGFAAPFVVVIRNADGVKARCNSNIPPASTTRFSPPTNAAELKTQKEKQPHATWPTHIPR